MSRLNEIKEKEKFLKSIEGVPQSVLSVAKENVEKLDLYTFFITYGACNTGEVNEKELSEFLLGKYADWFCLNQNNKSTAVYKITHGAFYSPSGMSGKECMELIKSGKLATILPIRIQYVNKLEDKFFVSIDVNKLYNQGINNEGLVRLYINMPANKIVAFAKEFIDRMYLLECPCKIKFLNNDSRCDTVVIYTEYASVNRIVKELESIKEDYPSRFADIGGVNPLLSKVNDFVGFGEAPKNGETYFKSRTDAISAIDRSAVTTVLKDNFVAKEQLLIFRTDGRSYTPTEYLMYLVERVAIGLVEEKIVEKERGKTSKAELFRLYKLREAIEKEIEIDEEVKKLKRCLTRNGEYQLDMGDIGVSNYDFVGKLYRLFTTEGERLVSRRDLDGKKSQINSVLFRVNGDIDGVNVEEFLKDYFRVEVATALEEIINSKMDELKVTRQSSILSNLKQKQIIRLRTILKNILNDSDDGKEYLDKCIADYVRILSTDAIENVEVYIDDCKVSLASNINEDIISLLPNLQTSADNLTIDGLFIDKTLLEFGINKDNLAIGSRTKNISKERIFDNTLNDNIEDNVTYVVR